LPPPPVWRYLRRRASHARQDREVSATSVGTKTSDGGGYKARRLGRIAAPTLRRRLLVLFREDSGPRVRTSHRLRGV
jgi:hypothetical protein